MCLFDVNMKLLILISVLTFVQCRPQGFDLSQKNQPNAQHIEIEKQELVELPPERAKALVEAPEERKIDEHTKSILAKIEEVNRNHGYAPKNGFQNKQSFFPGFFSKSIETDEPHGRNLNFQQHPSPFTNPILGYLNNIPEEEKNQSKLKIVDPVKQFSTVNKNAQILPEDHIPGQYIKRKVTHHQTVMMPMGVDSMNPGPYGYPSPQFYQQPFYPYGTMPNIPVMPNNNDNVRNVEKVDHHQYGIPPPFIPFNGVLAQLPPKAQDNVTGRQVQIPMPFQEYFPIVIRNPFQMMFNAVTSMVEYGPSSGGGGGACSREETNTNEELNEDTTNQRSSKLLKDSEDQYEEMPLKVQQDVSELGEKLSKLADVSSDKDIRIINATPNTELEISNIRIPNADGKSSAIEIGTIDLDTNAREGRKRNKLKRGPIPEEKWPNRNPTKDVIEIPGKKIVSLDGNQKQQASSNNGSGIFVSRLKVRKGGIAIAGPGGLATAGSGGTAIVGPNGYALTHPNSVAIAGVGTKVLAVNPEINIMEAAESVTKMPKDKISSRSIWLQGTLPKENRNTYYLSLQTPLTNIFYKNPVVHGWNGVPYIPQQFHYNQYYQFPRYRKDPQLLSADVESKQLARKDAKNNPVSAKSTQNSNPIVSSVLEEIRVPSDSIQDRNLRNEKALSVEMAKDTSQDIDEFEQVTTTQKSLEPFKKHPLFHFLKNKNTLENDRVISFRNPEVPEKDTATLILKPVARAIAGEEGKAISTPISRAILRQGTNVDILFEPDAVAIAGPGGFAHAQSELEIMYEDTL